MAVKSPTLTLHPFWGNFRVGANTPGIRIRVPRCSMRALPICYQQLRLDFLTAVTQQWFPEPQQLLSYVPSSVLRYMPNLARSCPPILVSVISRPSLSG